MAAAYYQPKAFFYGIEQRKELVKAANTALEILQLPNVSFINENIIAIDLKAYDHFYFFNSFYENLDDYFKIDNEIPYSAELYTTYQSYVYKQLEKKSAGTRIATFHGIVREFHPQYYER